MHDSNADAAYAPGKRPKGHQFGVIEARVVRDKTLPRNVRTIYSYLALFADVETRESHPSQARMAEETGLSAAAITAAVKIGVEVGLWTITHERHPRNTYWLHDRGWVEGAYIVGSGPGERVKGKPRGRNASPAQSPTVGDGNPQTLGMESPTVGADQSQTSAPQITHSKTHSRGGSTASPQSSHSRGGPLASSTGRDEPTAPRRRVELNPPADYFDVEATTHGQAVRWLVKASVSVLAEAGVPMPVGGRDQLGKTIKKQGEGRTREGMVATTAKTLEALLAGDPTNARLIDPTNVRPPKPNLDDLMRKVDPVAPEEALIEYLHDEVGAFGVDATVYSMTETHHPNAIANTIRKRSA